VSKSDRPRNIHIGRVLCGGVDRNERLWCLVRVCLWCVEERYDAVCGGGLLFVDCERDGVRWCALVCCGCVLLFKCVLIVVYSLLFCV
jgi:hypothetical protein